VELERFILHDLNNGLGAIDLRDYDYVLLLDVIEHLTSPETFVQQLRDGLKQSPQTTIIVSTANIGFVINRLMLLAGAVQLRQAGHSRISRTAASSHFRRSAGCSSRAAFRVREMRGIPGPFALAFGDSRVSRALLAINTALIKLSRGLFSLPDVLHRRTAAFARVPAAQRARALGGTMRA